MSSVIERAHELAEELNYLDREEKFEWLINQGKSLEVSGEFSDSDLVKGCQSKVWVRVSIADDILHIQGTSDALIVKGIVGLLIHLFDQRHRSEVEAFDFVEWMGQHGLNLTYQRMQGLASLLQRIRRELAAEG
jgi:cysteine desulfuration protein SufE